MTVTLPTRPGQRRTKYGPAKDYVECPECGIPTGTFENAGCTTETLPDASGLEDGARCKVHARTLEERKEQTARGLNIALFRRAGPYLPDRGGWIAVDDIAQGTE